MLLLLSESWLLIGLRGLAFLAFGAAVALSSEHSYPALAERIGLLALADGVIHVILGARFRQLVDAWWLEALRGAVSRINAKTGSAATATTAIMIPGTRGDPVASTSRCAT